jgi:hypothetical protein
LQPRCKGNESSTTILQDSLLFLRLYQGTQLVDLCLVVILCIYSSSSEEAAFLSYDQLLSFPSDRPLMSIEGQGVPVSLQIASLSVQIIELRQYSDRYNLLSGKEFLEDALDTVSCLLSRMVLRDLCYFNAMKGDIRVHVLFFLRNILEAPSE